MRHLEKSCFEFVNGFL